MTRDEAIDKVGIAIHQKSFSCGLVDSLVSLDLLKVDPPSTLPLGFDQISHRAGSETTKLILRELDAAGLAIVRKEDVK